MYKSATETDPKNADAWVGLGQSHLGLGNIPGAEEALRQAQAIEPNNASLQGSWELSQKGARTGRGMKRRARIFRLTQYPAVSILTDYCAAQGGRRAVCNPANKSMAGAITRGRRRQGGKGQ